jgi:hypothetical protein
MIASWCRLPEFEGCLLPFTQVMWELSRSLSSGEFDCCRVPAWLR